MYRTLFFLVVCLLVLFHPNESSSSALPLRNLEPGSPVPQVTLPALGGGEAGALGADGEITVILFWGTDSDGKIERSVELLRTLQGIGESYGDRGVVVRSVNVDKGNRAFIEKLMADEGVSVPTLLDEDEKLYGAYGLYIFPTVAIVGRGGELVTAVGYTRMISEEITGQVEVMLGLKTAEELEKELNPEEVVEPPDNVMKAAQRLSLGRMFMEKRLFDMAGPEFEKAVELDPDNAEAHAEFGAFLVRADELERARAELDRAIELDPESARARFALASLYRGEGETEKAVAELEGILEADPTHSRATRELCVVFEDAGDIDKALECYRKALSLIFDDEPAAELDVPLAGAGASPDVADEPPPS
jgi:tetratricopeptide (TPR) repeat protein